MTNEELLNAIRTGNSSLLMELWNQNSGMIRKRKNDGERNGKNLTGS